MVHILVKWMFTIETIEFIRHVHGEKETHVHRQSERDGQTGRQTDRNIYWTCIRTQYLYMYKSNELTYDMDLILLWTIMNFCAVRAQLMEFNRGADNNE